MTKKVTGKDLKNLIKEAINDEQLNEKTVRIRRNVDPNADNDRDWFKSLGIPASAAEKASQVFDKRTVSGPKKLKKLRDTFADKVLGLDGEDDNLTNLDFDAALSKPSNNTAHKAVDAVIAKAGQGAWVDYEKTKDSDTISDKAKSGTIGTSAATVYEPETITKPRFYTAPSDAGAAKFLGSQNELMLSVFKKNTIAERLKELDVLTNNIFYNEDWYETNKDKPRVMLQAMMMVDLITHMSKEVSGYSGDGFFEAFCALICGGNVIGTDMGAADFRTGDGKLGSSKYYQKYKGMTQAVSGFNKGTVDQVHYVMAIKSGGEQDSAVSAAGGEKTTKAQEITYIDLHYSIVELYKQTRAKKFFKIYNINGDVLSEQEGKTGSKGGSLELDAGHLPKDTYVGTLRLFAGGVAWQEAFESGLKDGSSKEAFEASKNFFKELFAAEEETKIYMAKDKNARPQSIIDSGNSALEAFDKADGFLNTLVTLLSGGKTIKGARKSRQLSEDKITPEFLKKLIEESFKK